MKMLGFFILKIIFSLNNIGSCKKVCPIQIHGGIRIWKNLTTYKKQNTLKPRYNEPRYSEFRDIVNTIQLPL